jgi:hypothetical protein
LLFSVYACGFRPRCALEISDSSENRLSKIEAIIQQCKFGIHDISIMGIDPETKLARLNMAFELGFSRQLPAASKEQRLTARELTYPDLCRAIEAWLKENA